MNSNRRKISALYLLATINPFKSINILIMKIIKLSTIKYILFIVMIWATNANNGVFASNTTEANVLIKKANIAYNNLSFSIAANYYESYIEKRYDTQSDNVLAKLADCYWQMRAYDKAFRIYNSLYQTPEKAPQIEKLRIGELYARIGDYKQAAKWLRGVVGYQSKALAYSEKSKVESMKKDSLSWKLNYVNINTPYRDFSPYIVNDNLFFSSNKSLLEKKKAAGWDGNNYTHLWQIEISKIGSASTNLADKKELNKDSQPQKMPLIADVYELADVKPKDVSTNYLTKKQYMAANLNAIGNVVKGLDKILFNAGTVSVDKNNQIYFSSNYPKADKNGVNRIRLETGIYNQGEVSSIKALPFGDPNSYSVMHPAVNAEGTILVCSSDMPNGKGGYDLYYSVRSDSKQAWSALKPLDKTINTEGHEVFPCITNDGYLYFSSDATPGLGGLDIFKISLADAINGGGRVEHLSYPINSSSDDFGWTQDSTGTKGYFTSDRFSNNDNIYGFEHIKRQPLKAYVVGTVLDKENLQPLSDITIFLYDKLKDSVYVTKSDSLGRYRFPILASANVVILTKNIIIKPIDKRYIGDCLPTSIVYNVLNKDSIQNAPRSLLLDKYKVGFVWKLNNIHYDFNKGNIRSDAKAILNDLVKLLNNHDIKVELGSHTDSRGSFAYNERLSQHRADSAVAYLIKNGISPSRITAKGYGEYQLLNKCADGIKCSEVDHQANRRTEVKVTGYTTIPKNEEIIDTEKYKDGDVININELPKDFFKECE
jgi:outer membrane protein OmpA-like peptidoglycan-associated protein